MSNPTHLEGDNMSFLNTLFIGGFCMLIGSLLIMVVLGEYSGLKAAVITGFALFIIGSVGSLIEAAVNENNSLDDAKAKITKSCEPWSVHMYDVEDKNEIVYACGDTNVLRIKKY